MNKPNYNKLAETLRHEVCPTCKKHPEITVNNNKLTISTCCETFKDHLLSQQKKSVSDYLEELTKNILKSF